MRYWAMILVLLFGLVSTSIAKADDDTLPLLGIILPNGKMLNSDRAEYDPATKTWLITQDDRRAVNYRADDITICGMEGEYLAVSDGTVILTTNFTDKNGIRVKPYFIAIPKQPDGKTLLTYDIVDRAGVWDNPAYR